MNNWKDLNWHIYDCVRVQRSGGVHQDAPDYCKWVDTHKCVHQRKNCCLMVGRSLVCHQQPACISLIWSLFTQGRTEADMRGPGDQHSNADSTAPRGDEKVEEEKVEEIDEEEEECVITDQDSDTDSEPRGKGRGGGVWSNKRLNVE